MDIYKNPDEVIKEVEDEEARREDNTDVEHERDEAPEDQDTDQDEGED